MNEDTRVNHPSYYEKKVNDNRIHPECIELLEVITRGFPGILALDAGQLKYCYRFGSKAEEGLSRKEALGALGSWESQSFMPLASPLLPRKQP